MILKQYDHITRSSNSLNLANQICLIDSLSGERIRCELHIVKFEGEKDQPKSGIPRVHPRHQILIINPEILKSIQFFKRKTRSHATYNC